MTDNEIIKALECCSNEKCAGEKCPLYGRTGCTKECLTMISGYSLDLIHRQQERIEKLKDNLDAVLKERTDLDVDRVVERLSNNYRIVHSDEDFEWNRAITKAIEVVQGGE